MKSDIDGILGYLNDLPPLTAGEEVLLLNRAQVKELARMEDLIPLMSGALLRISERNLNLPMRQIMPLAEGAGLGSMPGYLSEPSCFGTKVTSVFPDNRAAGYQSHQGVVLLFEPNNGCLRAIIHGGEVTARRTGAVSAAATDLLARKDASTLAILGYGEQAWSHLEAIRLVRPIEKVRIWGRSATKAAEFARSAEQNLSVECRAFDGVEETISHADIICTVTASNEPVLFGDWVAPGTHVNVIGSSVPDAREVDSILVARSKIYADYRPAALALGGEILAAQREGVVTGDPVFAEVGDVLLGKQKGRESSAEITMFKGLGISAEDLIVSLYLYKVAKENGLGAHFAF